MIKNVKNKKFLYFLLAAILLIGLIIFVFYVNNNEHAENNSNTGIKDKLLCDSYTQDSFDEYFYDSKTTDIVPGGSDLNLQISEVFNAKNIEGDVLELKLEDIEKLVYKIPGHEASVSNSFSGEEKISFRKTIWPVVGEKGVYEYCVFTKAGKTYNIYYNWNGVKDVKISVREESESHIVFEIEEIDLNSFDIMYHIKPFGTVEKFIPRGLEYLSLDKSNMDKGQHTFLIKKDGQWYKAVVQHSKDPEEG